MAVPRLAAEVVRLRGMQQPSTATPTLALLRDLTALIGPQPDLLRCVAAHGGKSIRTGTHGQACRRMGATWGLHGDRAAWGGGCMGAAWGQHGGAWAYK